MSRLPIEGMEPVCPGSSRGRCDHLVGKSGATPSVALGSADDIVGNFNMKFFRSHKFLEYVCYSISREAIRTF